MKLGHLPNNRLFLLSYDFRFAFIGLSFALGETNIRFLKHIPFHVEGDK